MEYRIAWLESIHWNQSHLKFIHAVSRTEYHEPRSVIVIRDFKADKDHSCFALADVNRYTVSFAE